MRDKHICDHRLSCTGVRDTERALWFRIARLLLPTTQHLNGAVDTEHPPQAILMTHAYLVSQWNDLVITLCSSLKICLLFN